MKFGKSSGKIVTQASQSFSFTRRAMVLGGIQGGVGLLLAGRMAWISVAENEKYQLLSESNRVNLTLIPPRRGWIVDRHGRPLANNRTDFRVDIIPDRLRDKDATIASLARILAIQPDEVERIHEDLEKAAGFQPVEVAANLDYEQYAAVSVRLPDLPGVAPAQGFSRHYPAGAAVGHLIGYVGTASAKDYETRRDPLLITPGFKIGKDGLESSLERELTGKPGAKRVEVTARGKIVRELTTRPDTPGKTIRMTIDAGLQEYAGRRLGTQSGSVVVIDCHSGDLLAMASMPSYDPNSFSDGISHAEWDMLSQDDHVPLRNKTLKGLYPPGSTVKPMAALAFLEAGLRPEETVNCSGAIRVGNALFHCWSRRGHGAVNMHRGIAQSCDIYFYVMAQRMGMQVIADMARRLGMGQKFPLPYPSQSYGTVPDPAWKLRKYQQDWQIYDTVNATIGQGYMLINPTQLAVMASRIASGKELMPQLMYKANRQPPKALGVSQEHLSVIHNAMSAVVNGGGTGGAARLPVPDVLMAGKTGTAQVRRITMAERAGGVRGNASLPFKLRDHALFQGFAPYDNPRYAVGTIIEHGGHVSRIQDAPMISADVISYLFDPAKAVERLEKYEKDWGGPPATRLAAQMAEYRRAKGLAAVPGDAAPPTDANAANVANAADDAAQPPSNAAHDGDVPE
ncbi:penicillin-binding protein 2 [Sphingobium phenoxybenzoativorans]|uniref:Penicillin-binding protein 2 n=1 Tax=Sphingobium phenoxybenzoativorans TaxID=1592790 RepID=A0A975KB05_9SPHN|nr:penicillin-binding protein 2 [Sphingobium phenoxybenzoativorans]QUT07308.1 penicillin-binding protein 2 [Sphingobium phenoxybenzoativorans]